MYNSQPVYLGKTEFSSPAPNVALLFLIYDAAVWYILGWYFNNILGEGALPPYFMFTREYWGLDKLETTQSLREASLFCLFFARLVFVLNSLLLLVIVLQAASAASIVDAGLGMDVTSVAMGADAQSDVVVRVSDLGKTYQTGCCGSSKNVAVENVSFEIRRGEIFGLLGHNGAGKSTTINMLTGLTVPSCGELEVGGLSVGQNLAQVRRMLGVCPQHDILFETLTAMEHLVLYAQIVSCFHMFL